MFMTSFRAVLVFVWILQIILKCQKMFVEMITDQSILVELYSWINSGLPDAVTNPS